MREEFEGLIPVMVPARRSFVFSSRLRERSEMGRIRAWSGIDIVESRLRAGMGRLSY